MANQPDVVRGRPTRITTAGNAGEPDSTTTPTITLAPQSGTGLKTTGTLLSLQQVASGTAAVPTAGGFSLVPWIRNPATLSWASGAAFAVDYRQMFHCFAFDACELYIQIEAASVATPGSLIVEMMEQ